MADPYGWYSMATYGAGDTTRSLSLAEVLVIVLAAVLVIALSVAVDTWGRVHRRTPRRRPAAAPLGRRERRRLAQIERRLSRDDPGLARMLTHMRFAASTTPDPLAPYNRRQEPDQ